MLQDLGLSSLDQLFTSIPEELRHNSALGLPDQMSELDTQNFFCRTSRVNFAMNEAASFVGGGAYQHYVPALVDYLSSRGEFLTPYTPYQPEVSQGTLQAIFEFQTMITYLTGLDVANASIYDGASAAAEAVLMANRITRKRKIIVNYWLHPDYLGVIESYTKNQDIEILTVGSFLTGAASEAELSALLAEHGSDVAAVLIQSPNYAGIIENLERFAIQAQSQGALLIAVAADAIALGYLQSPGSQGADIFAGEGQSLGNYVQFGGPGLGLFAVKEKYLRQMPGRLVGQCPVLHPEQAGDKQRQQGYVLTLSAREQHIRREKATSNICTNQGLIALRAAIYMSIMGRKGFFALAKQNHANALYLAHKMKKVKGWTMLHPDQPFYHEFILRAPVPVFRLLQEGKNHAIIPGIDVSQWKNTDKGHYLLVTTTEMTGKDAIDKLVYFFAHFS